MTDCFKNSRVAERFTLKNKKWNYRGEGNANLVLSLLDDKQIMRLRKSFPGEAVEDRIWLETDFCRWVMQPLLGESFVNVPTVVCLPETDLMELNEKLLCMRPARRHNKGIYSCYAAIFPDLCLLPACSSVVPQPTFCVEVKPKQGWIPFPDRRLSKCTFCLNQYLKLKQGIVKTKSQYCPLDLFSGHRVRMKQALMALLMCPQNNFKVFKNGNLIYGDSTSQNFESILEDWFGFTGWGKLVENFTNLVIDALLSDRSDGKDLDGNQPLSSSFGSAFDVTRDQFRPSCLSLPPRVPQHMLEEAQRLISGPSCYQGFETLPENCILSRILKVQKLDTLGSDEIYRLHKTQPASEDFAYVYDMLLSRHTIYKPINAYLLSTTAKDCSILVAFRKTSDGSARRIASVTDLNGDLYAFNIGISDLDPKPASCIEKHKKRDNEIVTSCIEVLSSYFGINNILYQRGIYPQETFEQTKQYGVTILVSTDPKIKAFLNNILNQTKEWLSQRKIKKVSLVIKNLSTKETVECWDFNVEYERGTSTLKKGLANPLTSIENQNEKLPETGTKDLKEIQMEIRDVMLQICSTVTFLPLLDCLCAFDVLVYTFKDCEVPDEWNESEPCFIANCQQVQFKPFSTSLHRVDTAVSYKGDF
ncbi:hypothetical protein RUM43_011597 [Polyplax serrata]|uniref:Inositol-pentakisphosphate 2-kinase n=1 Tax=Polyplax serrata TaxID=468196 RepID=A0AAN8P8D0_POLSC